MIYDYASGREILCEIENFNVAPFQTMVYSIQPLCLDTNSHQRIDPEGGGQGVSLRAHHPGYAD